MYLDPKQNGAHGHFGDQKKSIIVGKEDLCLLKTPMPTAQNSILILDSVERNKEGIFLLLNTNFVRDETVHVEALNLIPSSTRIPHNNINTYKNM